MAPSSQTQNKLGSRHLQLDKVNNPLDYLMFQKDKCINYKNELYVIYSKEK